MQHLGHPWSGTRPYYGRMKVWLDRRAHTPVPGAGPSAFGRGDALGSPGSLVDMRNLGSRTWRKNEAAASGNGSFRNGARRQARLVTTRAGGTSSGPWESMNLGPVQRRSVGGCWVIAPCFANARRMRCAGCASAWRRGGRCRSGPGRGGRSPEAAAFSPAPNVVCTVLVADYMPVSLRRSAAGGSPWPMPAGVAGWRRCRGDGARHGSVPDTFDLVGASHRPEAFRSGRRRAGGLCKAGCRRHRGI